MYLFSKTTLSFYPTELLELYKDAGTLPSDLVEVNEDTYNTIRTGLSVGKVVTVNHKGVPSVVDYKPNKTDLIAIEKSWRDSELFRADVELNKVQDGDNGTVGTVTEWRKYRKELRAWPENPSFPSKVARPIAPDKIK